MQREIRGFMRFAGDNKGRVISAVFITTGDLGTLSSTTFRAN